MKILKIEPIKMEEGEKIIVTIEEYPHAQPIFDAGISAKDLEIALKEWKINQDEVDAINKARREEIKPISVLDVELKDLEGKEI